MFFRPPQPQLITVPHVQQAHAGECLAACAQMVCRYLGINVDYRHLIRLLEIQQEVGVSFAKIHNLAQLRLTVTYEKGGTLPYSIS